MPQRKVVWISLLTLPSKNAQRSQFLFSPQQNLADKIEICPYPHAFYCHSVFSAKLQVPPIKVLEAILVMWTSHICQKLKSQINPSDLASLDWHVMLLQRVLSIRRALYCFMRVRAMSELEQKWQASQNCHGSEAPNQVNITVNLFFIYVWAIVRHVLKLKACVFELPVGPFLCRCNCHLYLQATLLSHRFMLSFLLII